jgi:hypothetical protein
LTSEQKKISSRSQSRDEIEKNQELLDAINYHVCYSSDKQSDEKYDDV